VREEGSFPAEAAVKHHVQRQRRKPLLAPDHVRDLHQMIINDVGKVIGWHTIRLVQHLVIERGAVDHDVTPDQVIEVNVLIFRHTVSYHIILP